MLSLRQYQRQGIDGVNALIRSGSTRPVLLQATGLGKTVSGATWIAEHHAAEPRGRTLFLVHRDELAQQARDEIHGLAPHLRPGIVMGQQSDHDRPVVIASTQTLGRRDRFGRNKRREQIHSVRRIVYDEAHHAASQTAREILDYFGAFAGVPTLGLTATLSRQDTRGLGEVWTGIVERPEGGLWDVEWGVRNGWLVTPRGFRVQVPQLDLSGVHIRAGDLAQEETATAMLNADTGAAIVKAIQDPSLCRCDGTDRGVIYCPNVATAVSFAQEMNAAGIATGVILGSTPREERRAILARFRTGELEWITNFGVLTEGWNAPWCNVLIIARPTKSSGLYQQMIGRGLRTWPGKTECIVLDVCGVTEIHGLAGLADLSMDRKIKPRDGQSLLEAMEEWDDAEWSAENEGFIWHDPPPPPVHHVIGTEIDMFGKSHSVWLQTRRGTWFVPAADLLFFLWPQSGGLFAIYWTTKTGSADSILIQPDLELDIAMALAEQHAHTYAPQEAGKDAPWRQTGPIRPGQKAELKQWRIPVRKTMTAATAYDELCIAMASVRLDWAS